MTSPPTLPAFALTRQTIYTLPHYLRDLVRRNGPVVRFANLRSQMLFLADPPLVEDVLVTKGASFMKGRGTQRLALLLGRGLLTSERPEHVRHRRLIQPAFHRRRIEAYAHIMTVKAERAVDGWEDGEIVDVERATNALALEIVAQALFGSDLRADVATIGRALGEALAVFPATMLPYAELLDRLPVPSTRRLAAAKRALDEIVYRMIREHRAGSGDPDDLLSLMLGARDEAGGGALTDEQIHDEALTILLAGHETTANALAWAVYLLGRHPEIEARLAAHVRTVLGERPATAADVADLDYVRAVFAEALRLYPPAWITARRALEPVMVGPHRLARGDIAIVSPFVSHRDERYFADPERFDPGRWSGAPPPRYAYYPFGGGSRLCIGEGFAWMEGVLVLAAIVRRVSLPATGGDVRMLPLVTLRPRDAIRARVARRRDVVTA